jgi:hypothetical protein
MSLTSVTNIIGHPVAAVYGAHAAVLTAATGGITCTPTISSVTPTATLPGSALLTTLLSGVLWFGVALSIVGLIVSAIAMAVGSHSSNSRLAEGGRRGLMGSAIAALVCGAAVAIVNFAFAAGGHVHC